MHGARLTASLIAIGLVLAGCGNDAEPPSDSSETAPPDASEADPAFSDVELVASLRPEDAPAVGEAVNAFGFDLLNELTDGAENTITSPLSVATMLAMTLAGAGGDTADAMAEVLHLDNARDVRVGALLETLTDTEEVTLSVANALWGDQGVPFEADYLDFIQETFDATAEEADLGSSETAAAIDDWVVDHTEGLVDGIAEDLGLPDPSAVVVLLNAVYFLGEWTTQFDAANTRDEPFTLATGDQVDVPLMHMRDETFEYTERDGYRMLRLPYGEDGRYGMEVLLPDEDVDLTTMLSSVDAAEWRAATDDLDEREIAEVAMPKFELEWDSDLTDPLTSLGMGPALGSAADFRPMSSASPWLDTVAHKTYIRVDEEGTEAAAVTGGVGVTSATPDELDFRVDRPFAFTISDTETETILFLGTVTDPRG